MTDGVTPPGGVTSPAGDTSTSTAPFRHALRQTLPEYMVPAHIVRLDALPTTPSGKVDRDALPAPDRRAAAAYVAPRTPTEERLANLCAELLDLDQVGVTASFFDLGGHSLLATQFISRVREAFGVELPLRALFEGPSVADIAAAVERAQEEQTTTTAPPAPAIKRISRAGRRTSRATLDQNGAPAPAGPTPPSGDTHE